MDHLVRTKWTRMREAEVIARRARLEEAKERRDVAAPSWRVTVTYIMLVGTVVHKRITTVIVMDRGTCMPLM
jgi:hypothetical protein